MLFQKKLAKPFWMFWKEWYLKVPEEMRMLKDTGAGKTGTSETDVEGVYVASFAAIAPADNPRICVLVALDNPRGESYYGGTIAAPVAGKIVEETLSYLGVERRYTDKDMEMIAEEVYVPDVRDKTIDEAKKILKEYGLEYRIEGDSTDGNAIIKEQTPKPGAQLAKNPLLLCIPTNRKNK